MSFDFGAHSMCLIKCLKEGFVEKLRALRREVHESIKLDFSIEIS